MDLRYGDPRASLDPHVTLAQMGWFHHAPNAVLGIKVAFSLAAAFILVQIIRWCLQAAPINPFREDSRKRRRPYILDQGERDEVIKQNFAIEKVPSDLDAIVVGSGAGGLATAVTLAKAGRRVLVLEQHDQAGGSLHTFVEKGYEFDVGVHYVGEMSGQDISKFTIDQLTDGQIEWERMEDSYDVVSIGLGEENRKFKTTGKGLLAWEVLLYEQFPGEKSAIDKYFKLLTEVGTNSQNAYGLKLMPLWVAWLIINTGILQLVTPIFGKKFRTKSTLQLINDITENQDLRQVMCYLWGDLGVVPSESCFNIHGLITSHYTKSGGYYPVGGASEFALSMIPIVERAGGKVLVRANVEQILHNGRKVMGVRVRKGNTSLVYDIEAPCIISNAGLKNTFQKLLPKTVAEKSYFHELSAQLRPSWGTFQAFIGLNASKEELGLKPQNTWVSLDNSCGKTFSEYMNLKRGDAVARKPPLMFISFPSAKDPNWEKHAGREHKSTCILITGAKWEWYEEFAGTTLHKRGDEYEELKAAFGDNMVEMACEQFPQLRHHIDYVEFSTPLTNNHYFSQQYGETYGLDNNKERFDDPWLFAKLRPETDVPGLYLTGQDTMSVGVLPSLVSGVFAGGAVIGRPLAIMDLEKLHKRVKDQEVEGKKEQ